MRVFQNGDRKCGQPAGGEDLGSLVFLWPSDGSFCLSTAPIVSHCRSAIMVEGGTTFSVCLAWSGALRLLMGFFCLFRFHLVCKRIERFFHFFGFFFRVVR